MKKIYLDYSATTPLDADVFDAMRPYMADVFGNADSSHSFGRDAGAAVDEARRSIAEAVNASFAEVYFTSGGTEANNWAVKGIAFEFMGNPEKKRIITSAIEHPSLLESVKFTAKLGFEPIILPVERDGRLSAETLERALCGGNTALVSIMTANNETGTLQDVKRFAEIAHAHGALFHTDAVQAVCSESIDVKETGADMMTLSAHKIYGPKGIGALYVRKGVKTDRLICGGHQERTMRGGTTNVAGAVGFAAAMKKISKEREVNNAKIKALRDRFYAKITAGIAGLSVNGDMERRVPQNLNITVGGLRDDSILHLLDRRGVACSSGSACASGSLDPSHVLLALGLSAEQAKASVRFSFGKYTTEEETDRAAEIFRKCVLDLRKLQKK